MMTGFTGTQRPQDAGCPQMPSFPSIRVPLDLSVVSAMSTNQRYEPIGAILSVFEMGHQFIRGAVEEVPESRMTEQVGTLVNHPAWTIAHLNAYAGVLLALLDEGSVSGAEAEVEKFGYGSVPVAEVGAYPGKDELLGRFGERHARIGAVVAEKHSAYFPRPAPEKFQPHCATIGHVAIILMTTHLGHHLGQLNQWRRAAGIGGRG